VPNHTNRLIHESSPYLLQHAHNPVDWYPWGPEAFEAARAQDKPIFLSVGYSTCYWCHVMERQSFENEHIADEMNRRFINIKVDREERPDVDALYMTAVQVLTGQGGWPMSVFLRPDLSPFYGGTYFPPTDAYGRPGFLTVLRGIDEAWRSRRADVDRTSQQLTEVLRQVAQPPAPDAPFTIDAALIERLVERSVGDYDAVHGGFGAPPKFPRQTLLEMLLAHGGHSDRVRRTLDAMADGGIHDHLGGGFHRYATDARWLVPHFEIMLYDNAMLAQVYAQAHRQTGSPRYADVARGICDFVLGQMTSPDGAFYTAFDAEVDAEEGKTYLWTRHEIEQVLGGDDAALFFATYALDSQHGIIHRPRPVEYEAPLERKLDAMRRRLLAERVKRKQPMLDRKVLTSWNALMIRALGFAARALDEPRYLDAANRAADWLLKNHRRPDGTLMHSWRPDLPSSRPIFGMLDDYAFFAQALLELGRVEQATVLADQMDRLFADPGGGWYFTSADATDLIVRQKVGTDSPLPSGNAVAAMVMQQVGRIEATAKALACFAPQMASHGEAMSAMIQSAHFYIRQHGPIVVGVGQKIQEPRTSSIREQALGAVRLQTAWVSPVELHVTVQIKPGMHIHANQAAEGMVPTQLLVNTDDAKVSNIHYPPAQSLSAAFSDDALPVYAGQVCIAVRFDTPPAAGVRLALTYQPCTDSACLVAVTQRIDVSPG